VSLEALSVLTKIGADLSGLKSGIVEANKSLGEIGRNASTAGLDSLVDKISAKLGGIGAASTNAGLALSATLTTSIIAAGAAALAVGAQFDDAFDKIRLGSGATGEELDRLQQSFRNVAASTPSSFDDISTALTELSRRTSATGTDLEALTKTELDLARITGGDLKQQIASTTRLFGDWGISIENQTPALDSLLKVSQKTGVGVTELSQKLVQFGAPLRQLGFSFEQASAIIGKFEKEGVNTELVMGSLRIALGKMSKEGIKDPTEALQKLTEQIKNAGSAGQANAIALKAFGARAGADMAAAIREGRFEIGELLNSIKNSPETIADAASSTADFAEQFTILKNKVLLALEPLGTKLFQAVNNMMPLFEKAVGVIERLANWFGNLSPSAQTAGVALGAISAAIGPILVIFGQIASAISSIVGLFGTFGAGAAAAGEAAAGAAAGTGVLATAIELLTGPVGIAIAAITALVVAYTTNFAGIGDAIDGLVQDLVPIWNLLVSGAKAAFEALKAIFEAVKPVLSGLLTFVGQTLSALIDIIRAVLKAISGDWSGAWELLKSAASKIWEGIVALIKGYVESLKNILELTWKVIVAAATAYWNGLVAILSGIWNGIQAAAVAIWNGLVSFFTQTIPAALSSFVEFFESLPSRIGTFLSQIPQVVANAFGFLLGRSIALAEELWEGIKSAFSTGIAFVAQTVSTGFEAVVSFFASLPNRLIAFVVAAWEGIKSAFTTGVQFAIQVAVNLYNGVREWISKLPELFTQIWTNIIDYIKGIPGRIWEFAKSIGSAIWNGFKEGLDIHSPSGPEKEVTRMVAGIEITLKASEAKLYDRGKLAASALDKAFKEGLKPIEDWGKSVGLTLDLTLKDWKGFSDEVRTILKQHAADLTASREAERQAQIQLATTFKVSLSEINGYLKALGSQHTFTAAEIVSQQKDVKESLERATVFWLLQKEAMEQNARQAELTAAAFELPIARLHTISDILKLMPKANLSLFAEGAADKAEADGKKFEAALKRSAEQINKFEEAARNAAQRIPESWNKIVDAVLKGSGAQGEALTALQTKYKNSIGDILDVVGKMPGKLGDSLRDSTSKITQWLDFINAALKSLHNVWAKVPEDLGGVFSKVSDIFKKSGKQVQVTAEGMADDLSTLYEQGSKDVSGLAENSEASGGKINKAFGAALAGVQGFISGLTTANATGSKAIGALAGGIQGALAGLATGNPIAAIVGGIGGILGGLFGGGKSAAEKERERLELQRLKQDVQKGAQEVMQAALDTVKSALDAFEHLADFTKSPKKVIDKFFAQLTLVVQHFIALAKIWSVQMVDAAKVFASSIGPILDSISTGVEAFEKLSFFTGVPDLAIQLFGESLQRSVELFIQISDEFEGKAVKHAKKFAKRASEVVSTIGLGVEAFLKLNDYKGISAEVFDLFAKDLDYAVQRMIEVSEEISNKGMKWAAKFSERALSIVTLIKEGVDSLAGVNDYQKLNPEIFDSFLTDLKLAVEKMQGVVTEIDTTMLSIASAFAQKSLAVFAAIKAGVEAFTSLRDYKSIPKEALQAVIEDFKAAVVLLGDTLSLALEGEKLATAFKDAAIGIAAALADAGKALSGLGSQAAQATTTAAASVVTASVIASAAAAGAGTSSTFAANTGAGTTNISNGNIYVNIEAKDIRDSQHMQAIFDDLRFESRTRIRRT
jgi:TP901 family phage tail tape measure protein